MNEFQTWLAKRLDELGEKMDGMNVHMGRIDQTLVKNASDIEHHIRRTDALEAIVQTVEADVEPIKTHVDRIQTVSKFVVWVGGAIAAVLGLAATIKGLLG